MAALTPAGTAVVVSGTVLAISAYTPLLGATSLGTASIHTIDGYFYHPPTDGQLWPRGDYAPL